MPDFDVLQGICQSFNMGVRALLQRLGNHMGLRPCFQHAGCRPHGEGIGIGEPEKTCVCSQAGVKSHGYVLVKFSPCQLQQLVYDFCCSGPFPVKVKPFCLAIIGRVMVDVDNGGGNRLPHLADTVKGSIKHYQKVCLIAFIFPGSSDFFCSGQHQEALGHFIVNENGNVLPLAFQIMGQGQAGTQRITIGIHMGSDDYLPAFLQDGQCFFQSQPHASSPFASSSLGPSSA